MKIMREKGDMKGRVCGGRDGVGEILSFICFI
jgi:hypothetical protein